MEISKFLIEKISDIIKTEFKYSKTNSFTLEQLYEEIDVDGLALKSFSTSIFDFFNKDKTSLFFYLVISEEIENKISRRKGQTPFEFSNWQYKSSGTIIANQYRIIVSCFEINTLEEYLQVLSYLYQGYTSKSFLSDKEIDLSHIDDNFINLIYNRHGHFRDYQVNVQYVLDLGYSYFITRGGFDYGSYCLFLICPTNPYSFG